MDIRAPPPPASNACRVRVWDKNEMPPSKADRRPLPRYQPLIDKHGGQLDNLSPVSQKGPSPSPMHREEEQSSLPLRREQAGRNQ